MIIPEAGTPQSQREQTLRLHIGTAHAGSVLVIDRGDYSIVRPIPADTVATLHGSHAGPGPTSDQARATERKSEADVRSRKGRSH